MNLTEFEAAQYIRDGTLASPVKFSNMWLVNLRITGTGAAYRYGLQEFVWRNPNIYLNEAFLLRCNGLPVLHDHAEEAPMSEEEFKKRCVGSVMLPYIKGDEVWAIVRIYVKEVVDKITKEETSTSPSVIFGGESGCVERSEGDSNFLIEGVPFLLDHIAVVTKDHGSLGVWDTNGIPAGIDVTNKGVIDMEKEELQSIIQTTLQKAVSDALGGVNSRLDTMSSRMDSQDALIKSRQDAEAEKAKQDSEEKEKAEKEEKAKQDAAEKERQDAEDAEAKKKAEEEEKTRSDAEAEEKAKQDSEEKSREDSAMTAARVRCDSAYTACGKRSPEPFSGERSLDYRKRALEALQKYSPENKDVNIRGVSDAAVLTVLEKAIYEDARKAIDDEMNNTQGQLHKRVRMDEAGRSITEYHGDPNVWLAAFKTPPRLLSKINTQGSLNNGRN